MKVLKKIYGLRLNCKVKWMQLRYHLKKGIFRLCDTIIKLINKTPLPMIILFTMLVLIAIVLCIFNPHLAVFGEERVIAFYYKLELFGVLLTAVSLIAATITILLAIQKPKLKIYFYNEHGSSLIAQKDEVELGIDKDGNVGYQGCVPTKWNMNLINTGHKTAEKVKIKISFDNIYFDMSLAEKGYDLEKFEYGCGIFDVISFEVVNLLRQGEQIVIPDLPFDRSVCDSDELRKRGYTYLRIKIFSGNHEPILLKYKIMIRNYDLDSFGYAALNEDNVDEYTFKRNFYDWYIDNYHITEELNEIYDWYYKKIDPYQIQQYTNIEESKYLYWLYKEKDIEKMLFWGRIYYRAVGMELESIEMLLQTEMMKVSVKKTMGKNGAMSII